MLGEMHASRAIVMLVALAVLLTTPSATRAELVEEIIAWVNGDIITLLDYQDELQYRTGELYRSHTGEQLDQQVELLQKTLLLELIDEKILGQQAQALGYDTDKLGEWLLEGFMSANNISSPEELEKLLAEQGLDLEETKQQILAKGLPGQVIQSEVYNRVSVGDHELEAYYNDNLDAFQVDGEVVLREIVLLADTDEKKNETRPRAQEIWQRATTEDDFGALAKEFSDAGTSEVGGEFGPLKRSDLSELLVEPAFMLPEGSVSELMETPYGFHILKVETRIDDRVKPLEEVREELRRYLREHKFREELASFMERTRSESEWCVKSKHVELLSVPAPPPCERL